MLFGPFYTDIPHWLGLSEDVDGAQTRHRAGGGLFFLSDGLTPIIWGPIFMVPVDPSLLISACLGPVSCFGPGMKLEQTGVRTPTDRLAATADFSALPSVAASCLGLWRLCSSMRNYECILYVYEGNHLVFWLSAASKPVLGIWFITFLEGPSHLAL